MTATIKRRRFTELDACVVFVLSIFGAAFILGSPIAVIDWGDYMFRLPGRLVWLLAECIIVGATISITLFVLGKLPMLLPLIRKTIAIQPLEIRLQLVRVIVMLVVAIEML